MMKMFIDRMNEYILQEINLFDKCSFKRIKPEFDERVAKDISHKWPFKTIREYVQLVTEGYFIASSNLLMIV